MVYTTYLYLFMVMTGGWFVIVSTTLFRIPFQPSRPRSMFQWMIHHPMATCLLVLMNFWAQIETTKINIQQIWWKFTSIFENYINFWETKINFHQTTRHANFQWLLVSRLYFKQIATDHGLYLVNQTDCRLAKLLYTPVSFAYGDELGIVIYRY